MLSIIIPTYNEGENVIKLFDIISTALSTYTYEIVFVDDSTDDDTLDKLMQLANKNEQIRFEHRDNQRGLGTAVVRGFELAKGDIIAVMDADLQHPPELLKTMLKTIEENADIVIPSRFVPGGDDGGLNILRKSISIVARYMGKAMLKALRSINDPTSGFFMFRRSVIDNVILQPIGWKILIEVLVRGKYTNVVEIPYHFRSRAMGQSKMSIKEQWNYICHLARLVKESPEDRRFYLFVLVGCSGFLVNMIFYIMLIKLHMVVILAGTISASIAMLSNFFLNDKYTWYDVRTDSIWLRASKFITTSSIGIFIDVNVIAFMFYIFGIHYIVANLLGIIAGTLWNYSVNNLWTWKKGKCSVNQS